MNVLDKIGAAAGRRLKAAKAAESAASLRRRAEAVPAPPSFRAALAAPGPSFIAEIKRASPSEGPLAPALDAAATARDYAAAGAAAVSVLTEPEFFCGALEDLRAASACGLPCLRKDFLLDEYHLLEARAAGAAGVLLIVALIGGEKTAALVTAAHALGLDALVEVHDEAQADAALAAGAEIIGVNNRDLKTLTVDLTVSERLAPKIKDAGRLLVAESGIQSAADVARLAAAGCDAFLVGTHLIKSGRPGAALRELRA